MSNSFANIIHVSKQNLSYSGVCLCAAMVLLYFVGDLIYSRKIIADLDEEIYSVQQEIENQKVLFPVFLKLYSKSKEKAQWSLPTPTEEGLNPETMENVPGLLKDLITGAKLETVSITPNVDSLLNNPRILSVDVVTKGSFLNFRNFLIALGATPSLKHMENIQIRNIPSGKELKCKIWLALNPYE